jgi:aminoglycoside phosphotransferase family enzyme/predicted kinase
MKNSRLDTGAEGLPADLCRPEAYPDPRPRGVTLASTHASWVFLTDDEVWKVKRPVSLGFLDYSTPEKRRRCCEEETRLGARLAPGVYLGVTPVYHGWAGFTFTGPGAVVDHALRMRRLSDADSARALLAAGRLEPDLVGHLAERLAAFYRAAPAVPEAGDPAVLAENVAQNRAQTLPFSGRFVERELVESVHAWQRETLDAHDALLRERVAAGRIRDGHGDLRLEHVYFPGGPAAAAIVIDPIEFDPRFRCQDVALDVAFLAMELAVEGRSDLAAFFLTRMARDGGDYAFYPLLDLYLSYRACVRAKVACFVAADPATAADKARRKASEAARLFAFADLCTRPAGHHPGVVAVSGTIGVGKSTVADALGRALRLPVVSSDATRKTTTGLAPTDRGGPELYTPEMDRTTLDAMIAHARSVLGSGRGVVLDATFRDSATRARVLALARELGRPFLLAEVRCDEETVRSRLRRRSRGPSVSDAGEELLPAIGEQWEPPDELDQGQRVVVDGAGPPEDAVRALERALGIDPARSTVSRP